MARLRWLVLLALLLVTPLVFAAAPAQMTVQGRLTNATNGATLQGNYSVNFTLWNATSGGTGLYTQTQSVTTDSSGLYAAVLTNIPLDFSSQYYLGVKVASDTEMSPRMNLTAVPYAFMAMNLSCASCNPYIGGSLGIGTTATTAPLTVSGNAAVLPAPPATTLVHIGGADTTNPRLLIDSFGSGSQGTIFFRFANNTAASPGAISKDAIMGHISWLGYGQTGYSGTARTSIRGLAAEGWNDTAQGTYLIFMTTAKGGTTVAEKMRIDDAGNVGINTTLPNNTLSVVGTANITGAVTTGGALSVGGALTLNNAAVSIPNNLNFDSGLLFLNVASNYVGVNTTTPHSALDVNGTITIDTATGTNATVYNDVSNDLNIRAGSGGDVIIRVG